ncbi:phosphatidic acid phosphatase type 2/haloperoxidase [Rhodotorula diobovata]|uniref:Phosphatidic acid phosphatase type 2/haloperoxidase n=1 Tax=Rhodotorula diobovata TaxID=5288 RepID=A0A5C5FPD1_9BASI|nr:phosphatidic acid phosphatase type 2/haloperoxidase [Rhodotorula diobovata]
MDFFRRLLHGPERKRGHMDPSRRWRLVASYAPDWVLTIILVALIGYFTDYAGGYKREFSLTDTSIQHTFATKQRISFGECIVYAGVIPAVIILLVALIWRRSFWDWHNGWLGLLLSVSLTTVFTQVIKITVGRPRPDLIDRCQPVEGAANRAVYGLATEAICTVRSGHVFEDGFRSFPSGHASFAWAGLLYLSMYLCGKMHIMDRRGHAFKAWIAITPPIGATLIAVSRTMDYRHHATDVIAGSILGAVIAVMTYHLYYPSLYSPQCHLPYSPRIPPTLPADRLDSDPEDSDETAPRPGQGSAAGSQRANGAGAGSGAGHGGAILPTHHRYSASLDSEQGGTSPLSAGSAIPLQSGAGGARETAQRPGGGDGQSTKSGYYEAPQHRY